MKGSRDSSRLRVLALRVSLESLLLFGSVRLLLVTVDGEIYLLACP